MSESNLKRLSGLWLRDKKSGGKFMSGNLNTQAIETLQDLGPCNLLVFKNEKKDNDKHPDYYLFAAPIEESNGRHTRDDEARKEQDEFF